MIDRLALIIYSLLVCFFRDYSITTQVVPSLSVMQNAFSPRLHLMDCLSFLDMVNMLLAVARCAKHGFAVPENFKGCSTNYTNV